MITDNGTDWSVQGNVVIIYIKHNDKDLYRSVSALAINDWGWSDVQVSEQEYEREVEQV